MMLHLSRIFSGFFFSSAIFSSLLHTDPSPPLRRAIALIRQHIITSSVFKLGASSLTWHLAAYTERIAQEDFSALIHCEKLPVLHHVKKLELWKARHGIILHIYYLHMAPYTNITFMIYEPCKHISFSYFCLLDYDTLSGHLP
jgi:hypothetical protein